MILAQNPSLTLSLGHQTGFLCLMLWEIPWVSERSSTLMPPNHTCFNIDMKGHRFYKLLVCCGLKLLKQCLGQDYSMCNFGLNFILPQPFTFITHFDSIRICLNSPGYIWGQHLSFFLLLSVATLNVILEGKGTTNNSKIKLPNTCQWQSVVENTLIWIKHLALHKMKYHLISRAFHKQVETNVIIIGREKNQCFDLKISLFWIVFFLAETIWQHFMKYFDLLEIVSLSPFFFLTKKLYFWLKIFTVSRKGNRSVKGIVKGLVFHCLLMEP